VGTAARPQKVPESKARTSWVRCICGGCERVGGGARSARQRGFRPGRRRRDRVRFDLVCPWCARGGLVPHSGRSRLTQPISGGGRRGQDGVRQDRASARRVSGPLDVGGLSSQPLRRSV